MPTNVMPEKVQGAAQSLNRLVRQRASMNGNSADVESFVILASVVADRIKADWDSLWTQLRAGTEAESVRTLATALSIAADSWVEATTDLQEMTARIYQETGESLKGAAQLAEEVDKVGEIRAAARNLLDCIIAACNSPLDEEMLKQSEQDFAAKRFQKGNDIIAQLRSRKSS